MRSSAHSSESPTQEVIRIAQVDADIFLQSGLIAIVVRVKEVFMSQGLLSATDQASEGIDTSWSPLSSNIRMFQTILVFGVKVAQKKPQDDHSHFLESGTKIRH